MWVYWFHVVSLSVCPLCFGLHSCYFAGVSNKHCLLTFLLSTKIIDILLISRLKHMLWVLIRTSNVYPQHMFSLRNKQNVNLIHPLIWSYAEFLTMSNLLHFMQIVSIEDSLHEMSKMVFWEKQEKYICMSSAKILPRVLSIKRQFYVYSTCSLRHFLWIGTIYNL